MSEIPGVAFNLNIFSETTKYTAAETSEKS